MKAGIKKFLSMILMMAMILSGTSTIAFAEDGDEDYDEEIAVIDETQDEDEDEAYTISIRDDIIGGSLKVLNKDEEEIESAAAGDTVYLVPEAEEDYVLTSIGYWTIDDDDEMGSLVEIEEDDGKYSFEMPESNVGVGAAFQDGPTLISNKIGGDKNTNYTLYMAIDESFIYESTDTVKAKLEIDKQFFDIEDDSASVILELRQYSSGYTLVGKETYSLEEFIKLFDDDDVTDDGTYIKELEFSVDEDVQLTAGYYVYCVIKVARDCWVDAQGTAEYRWTYTDDATVLADGATAPTAIVWMYNLDANTHRGSLIRGILDDLGIAYGTIDSSNLGQNIGYLVGWEGYEAVEDPYIDEEYNVEYMLIGNLTEVQLDDFLAAMSEENVYVRLKSVPTAWTASKTFNELFEIMAGEGDAIEAVVKLDALIYDCDKDVISIEGIEDNEYWTDFKAAYDAANEIITEEKEAEEYEAAYNALLEMYLKITGKILLIGDLELILEKQDDGTYTVSAELSQENATFTYEWQDGSTSETITSIAEDQLYKVSLEITGTGTYYGELEATFVSPSDPEYEISTGSTSLTVTFEEQESVLNMPEPIMYVVNVYLDGELISSQISVDNVITVNGLDSKTDYTVETYAYNVIGYTTINTDEATTTKASSTNKSSGSSHSLTNTTGSSSSSSSQTSTTVDSTTPVIGETTEDTPVIGETTSETTVTNVFTDVSPDDEYYDAIMTVYSNGWMAGVGDNKFDSEGTLTRAMAARIIWNMMGQPSSESVAPFLDVTSDTWYAEPVAWAYEQGIIFGYDDTSFGPDDYLTEEQFEMILSRIAGEETQTYTGESANATRGWVASMIVG